MRASSRSSNVAAWYPIDNARGEAEPRRVEDLAHLLRGDVVDEAGVVGHLEQLDGG